MVPLACLYGEKDHYHGIGDFQSLLEFGKWSKRTIGTSIIQLLPLNELSDGDVSPYGALSSFGLEPLYLSLPRISELSHDIVAILNGDIQPSLSRSRSFDESELIKQLGSQETRDLVQKANSSSKVLVDTVRQIKVKAFWLAYYRFIQQYPLVLNPSVSFLNVAVEEDAKDFAFFCVAENEWLHHYALFRAIKDEQYSTSGPSWESWPLELRERHPQALHEATLRLFKGYNFYRFIQWKVQKQLLDVKQELNHIGVELMGDMPFGVARNSVDVWAHRDQFDLSLVAGSPPDPMNPAGQNWGLPAFHWQRMRNHGFYWLRARTRRLASLYDRLRIDHILGYFRTYVYPCDQSKEINTETGQIPSGFCIPDKHEDMIRQGEEVSIL